MSEYEEAPPASGSRITGCIVQVLTHCLALLVGAVGGIAGANLYEVIAHPELAQRPEGDLSRADLLAKLEQTEKAYEDLLAETARVGEEQKAELAVASEKVTGLQGDISKKQEEIRILEEKSKKSANRSAALKKELEAKKLELEGLQGQLTVALEEKAKLEQDLVVSREETAVARQETDVARNQTVDAKWVGFKSDVLLVVCEKGNKNKLARCRDEVGAALTSSRASRFKHCLASGQAEPRMVRVDDKKEPVNLPPYSEWVSQESSFTESKFYFVFCDPSLPEAGEGEELTDDPL